jgi:hypothetical protein
MDRVQHSAAFMEALVQTLLQQVLERKGIASPGAAQRLLAALTAKAAAAGRASGAGAEPFGDVKGCSRSDAAAAATAACAVTAVIEQLTAAELLEVLMPASAQQKQQQKQQKVQQAQQQQESQAWSIKARASLTQQQHPQQPPSSLQPHAVEKDGAPSAGETDKVLACIRLSDGGGPAGIAAKQATAAALLPRAEETSPAEAADAPAPSSSSAAVHAAPLQNSSSFLSGLRQRVSFRLSRQDSGNSNLASQAAHCSAAASREPGAADGLGRPSYWGQLHKGHAAESDGESEVADEESAADLSAVVSGDGEEYVDGVAGVDGTDSKQLLPQQQLVDEGAAAGQLTDSSSSNADSCGPAGRVSGVTFQVAEQDAAADGNVSEAQLAALHEAAQLLQAYQTR